MNSLTKGIEQLGIVGMGTVIDNVKYIHPTAKIYHNCVIRSGVSIGEGVIIGHLVVVERDTKIGRFVTIQSQCHITADAIIEDHVWMAPCVLMSNERHIAAAGRCEPKLEGPIIRRGARIGAGAYIAAGVEIGENAFIYARSFVSKDVPAGEIWSNVKGSGRASKIGTVPKEEWK